ncbi:MAG: 2-amino-4-hydroxy-6-hydroxymethyldihydropteridine diphosphokinase [Candidatus Nanopelagicaceae bacterium]|nr:2-amino-4-hydroxy-6-hydroxymethyldihydropteridine diphosphokinase [Candidatus Nanopelagicaceae bacterium]
MRAVVALGANLAEPAEAVELALALLNESSDLVSRSKLYVTRPVGGPPQPDFVNAVCILESDLPAVDLLGVLQGIEKSMGRVRTEKWGPRVIDLDLIQYGSILSQDETLTLPHPLAHERRFVLEPWLEIDPAAVLITHGKVSEILAQLPPA